MTFSRKCKRRLGSDSPEQSLVRSLLGFGFAFRQDLRVGRAYTVAGVEFKDTRTLPVRLEAAQVEHQEPRVEIQGQRRDLSDEDEREELYQITKPYETKTTMLQKNGHVSTLGTPPTPTPHLPAAFSGTKATPKAMANNPSPLKPSTETTSFPPPAAPPPATRNPNLRGTRTVEPRNAGPRSHGKQN